MSRLPQLYQQAERYLHARLKNPAAYDSALRRLNVLMANSRLGEAEKIHDIYAQFLFRELHGELLELAIQADGGDAEAQNDLALRFLEGDGVKKSARQAVIWFRKAAEQGHAEAQYNYALCLEEGTGLPMDKAAALKWHRKAAEQGHVEAQFSVASCYDFGIGTPENKAEAVKWYALAAEQDHADAQYNLGCCYETGDGIPLDAAAAFRWFLRAAQLEHPIAQDKLAWCHGEGFGTAQDLAEAVKWLRRAAEQGVGNAMTHLGMCLEEGVGIARNLDEASKWYRKARELGEEGAARRLEAMQPSHHPFRPSPEDLRLYEDTYVDYHGRLAHLEGTSPDGSQLSLWFVGDPELTIAPAAECQVMHFTPESEYHGSVYALFTGRAAGSAVLEQPRTYCGKTLLYALQDLNAE
ncbi:MAG: sel1 repeat family protein [Victivallales bacterium]|nr:sel1 repeat family protein [Victivallales bacterium]